MTIDVTDAVGMGLEPDDADLGDRWRCHLDHVRHEPRSHVHAAVSTHHTPPHLHIVKLLFYGGCRMSWRYM